MKKIKKFLSVLLSFCMIVAIMQPISYTAVYADDDVQTAVPSNPVYDSETDTADWSYVYFGTYAQTEVTDEELTDDIINADWDKNGEAVVDGVTYRRLYKDSASYVSDELTTAFYNWFDKEYAYFKVEPIRWRVLENDGESLLLLADVALDAQPYCTQSGVTSWAECTLRTWLNETFYNRAFTEEEQAAILTSDVENADNSFHGTDSGEDTQDKVFLASESEVTNTAYGFCDVWTTYSKTRRIASTEFAQAMGAWKGTYNDLYYGNCWWLLRTAGAYGQAVSMVYPYGNVYLDGFYAKQEYYAVVPEIRIDINSTEWTLVDETETAERNAEIEAAEAAEKPDLPSFMYGDVDGDEEITLSDVIDILRVVVKLDSFTQLEKLAGDVDASGKVATADAVLVLERALKLISYFPDVEPKDADAELVQTEEEPTGTIWVAADSIAAVHGGKSSYEQPIYGWTEVLEDYFQEGVSVKQTALSSRSTRSFLAYSSYSQIMNNMQAGDYLFISFGHNDERPSNDIEQYTMFEDPFGDSDEEGSFKWYLKTWYIEPAIKAGVQPVLITPVVRRYFYNGELINPQLHTPYATAMKELVDEYAEQGITIYYIDLHSQFMELYEELGEEGTAAYHGLLNGSYDNTHLSLTGITQACEWIVEGIKSQNMSLAQFLLEE